LPRRERRVRVAEHGLDGGDSVVGVGADVESELVTVVGDRAHGE
jgi:hypothetical protein